ncbi:pyridoxal phosphate-dependent decarboxylase family protein [Ascoidea rubescens DSM 1968]|uniref:PLP-dependent transferase n=1 Tax=Ascoidea rubescens DSM 1968 TaxID=1344418 RepID=A0A1D2VAC8_9ASCO|nr:PLP-dependent transferase [Ascoidea rubescens DSM 1968]ODV58618.1 PLP-dependent transferase [Ascoidea rubescens DSM 1968]
MTKDKAEYEILDYLLIKIREKLVRFAQSANGVNAVDGANEPLKFYNRIVENGLIEMPDIGNGYHKQDYDKMLEHVDFILNNSVNTWSLGFLDKLYSSTNAIGVISDLVLSILNTNSHVFTVSPILTVIEKKIGYEYSKLFYDGYSENSGGLTFSGGSWSNISSLQIARSYLYCDSKKRGNGNYKFAVFTSSHSHYSVEKAAMLCGFGSESVFKIEVNSRGEMKCSKLEESIKKAIENGYTPLYVNATAGTTVFGSFDPLEEIGVICEKYGIWFHVDGSWGGNFIFSKELKNKLKGSHLANSITVSPHKMLGVPTTCSFLLMKDKRIFVTANSLDAPYLFHKIKGSVESGDRRLSQRELLESYKRKDDGVRSEENFNLAEGTMGCGRRADSLKFYLSWNYYGKVGFGERVDHAYFIMKYFSEKIGVNKRFRTLNSFDVSRANEQAARPPCLQVCFYYEPYEIGDKTMNHTPITRWMVYKFHQLNKYLIDFSPPVKDAHNEGEFFRIVFINPNLTTEFIDQLVEDFGVVGRAYMENNPNWRNIANTAQKAL